MRMGRGYISSGKGMDSVMNYQWMDSLIRYYNYGDTILALSNDLDMTPMLEKFQLVDEGYNAVLNDNLIIAVADILPNTKILLKL